MKNHVTIFLVAVVLLGWYWYANNRDGFYTPPKSYAGNMGTAVPLAEGELFMFSKNRSSPECCGSSVYSTSDGCLCVTPEQVNYINTRGGNRTAGDF
jgi:hypothetical protein